MGAIYTGWRPAWEIVTVRTDAEQALRYPKRMPRRVLAIVLLLLVGCSGYGATYTVRASDLASWKSVPVIELEKHTFFSTLPREVRPLSDGSELWDLSHCVSGKTQTTCRSWSNEYWANGAVQTTCSGGQSYTNCCHNQFIVRGGVVEEYRAVGNCYTDCSVRPKGVCEAGNQ